MGGFFGFLKGFSHSGSRQVRRSSRPLTRLALEELESRLTPSASTDNQVINQYRIFLKRLPEPPALASWSNELESGRISVGQMAERILHSPEYAKRTVTEFYATLFGRLPDRPGLAGHVQALQSGVPTLQVTAALLGSKEYFAWQGNDNRAFVESLYTGVLGRPSDNWYERTSIRIRERSITLECGAGISHKRGKRPAGGWQGISADSRSPRFRQRAGVMGTGNGKQEGRLHNSLVVYCRFNRRKTSIGNGAT